VLRNAANERTHAMIVEYGYGRAMGLSNALSAPSANDNAFVSNVPHLLPLCFESGAGGFDGRDR
jgi:hypothetical protein